VTPPIDANPLEAEPFLRHHPHMTGPHPSDADPQTAPRNLCGAALSKEGAYPWAGDQLDLPEPLARQLESLDAFAVLVIKIDPPAAAGASDALHQALMQILDTRAHPFQGAHWKESLYIGLLPDSDPTAADACARDIQAELARSRPETISIGITAFPLLDFNATQSVANGGKALDHAAFFGPGTRTVFDAVSLNISGDHYYQAGDVDQAIAQYHAARQLDPTNANVLNSLGVCLAHNGDLSGAQKLFKAAWERDATEAMAAYNLAMIHILNSAPQKALPLLEQAFALNRDCFDIPFRIGKLLHDQDAPQPAIAYLNRAIALREDCAAAHYYLGECLARTGQPRAAIATLSRAVKLNPNDAAALSALGALYTACNENPDICETFFQQSIALAPQKGSFHHRLGQFYQKHDQLEQALAAYQNAEALGHRCDKQLTQVRQQLNEQADDDVRCA
jgi:tetratricopeptide (TPR) repeat protein